MITNFFQYAEHGIPYGCVFGLLAVGLVLTFKTSGVFNLAFAAQAYASAAAFYETRSAHNWPLIPAAFVAIVIVGPAIGFILDRYLYRYQRTAGSLAKLITSLGLLVAVPEIIQLIIGQQAKQDPPPLWWVKNPTDFLFPHSGTFVLDAGQLATLVSTLVVVIGLVILFRRGGLGLKMRAVVESPRLVQLQGIDAERVSLASWILSSALAGLAGVLIAPLFAQLDPLDYFGLLVGAIAACVMGRLTSIVVTFLGGLALGILQAELSGFLPTASVLAQGLRPSLPFLVLFLLLVLRPSARKDGDVADPLGGVDPPPPPPASSLRPPWMTRSTRVFGVSAALIGLAVCLFVLDDFWLGLVCSGVALGIILLSVVVTTGVGGTISLCQGTFAAIGAFATAQAVAHWNVSVMLAMVIGAVVAGVVGAVLSLPIIRLAGIYPALATLAFALMFEAVLVPQTWLSGGNIPVTVPRPLIGSINFTSNKSFLLLSVFCLAILSVAVILIREGTTGRNLDAIRGSEAAARAIGINPNRPRFVTFVAGAAIAGFGGGLLASFAGQANYAADFTFYLGLVWLVLVITSGYRSVQSAVIGGITFFVFPQLLEQLFTFPSNYLASHPSIAGFEHSLLTFVKPEWSQGVAFILFGLGALTYAKHPEGIIEAQTSASLHKILGFVERRRDGKAPADAPPVGEPVGEPPGSTVETVP